MPDGAERLSTLAEMVRAACLDAALQAYEDAGIRGLCADGRWEAALGAMRRLDLPAVLQARPGPLFADATEPTTEQRGESSAAASPAGPPSPCGTPAAGAAGRRRRA